MESKSNPAPLVVIVGETGSGKTALGIEIAKRFNGEIIAADSRTVYKGMDIGTAKPTSSEQATAAHHLIDVIDPSEHFSASEFKRLSNAAILDINSRGKLPIIVGGTGLYVDSILYDFVFSAKPDLELRKKLQTYPIEKLQQIIKKDGLPMPENDKNPRHLMRVIETGGTSRQTLSLRPNTLVIGLKTDRDVLKERLRRRVDEMINAGFIDELKSLVRIYGWDAPGLQAPGYKNFRAFIDGEISLDEAKQLFVRSHIQLAKRQRTWFKRNKSVHWVSKQEEAVELVTTFLNK